MTETRAVYVVEGESVLISANDEPVLRVVGGAQPGALEKLPLFSQRDKRWAGDRMGGTAQTLGGWGCAVTCAAMVLAQTYPVDPGLFNAMLGANNGYNIINGREAHLAWERLPDIGQRLEWHGRRSWSRRLTNSELREVLTRLESGPLILWVDYHPQTLKMDTHFVVGLRVTADGRDIVIADPVDGVETRLLLRYGADGHDLARAIWGFRDLRAVV